MRARCAQEGTCRKNIICCMRIFCTYIVWCQLTHLHRRWRHLWHICLNVRPFSDMIVKMSEHSLMGKYSLVGCCTLIMYNIIDRIYVVTGNISCLSLFLLLSIYKTNKKKVYKNLRSQKSRTNYGTQSLKLT